MELLLNLLWLLLVLPAYWLWRKRTGMQQRGFSSGQLLLALGCLLVLLFPVISASDDLHAMRAEMEESAISKRTVRAAVCDRHAGWVNRLQPPPALMAGASPLTVPEAARYEICFPSSLPQLTRPRVSYAGRAPPLSVLA
jgi:hypothetical protein